MTKERKEQIIDDYIKDIKFYLNVGLCEGQANGSFGEDLMRHFDIIAECFKETTLLEHDLGIDLITLFKALKEGVYTRQYGKVEVCCIGLGGLLIEVNDNLSDTYYYCEYGKTWALTKEELL